MHLYPQRPSVLTSLLACAFVLLSVLVPVRMGEHAPLLLAGVFALWWPGLCVAWALLGGVPIVEWRWSILVDLLFERPHVLMLAWFVNAVIYALVIHRLRLGAYAVRFRAELAASAALGPLSARLPHGEGVQDEALPADLAGEDDWVERARHLEEEHEHERELAGPDAAAEAAEAIDGEEVRRDPARGPEEVDDFTHDPRDVDQGDVPSEGEPPGEPHARVGIPRWDEIPLRRSAVEVEGEWMERALALQETHALRERARRHPARAASPATMPSPSGAAPTDGSAAAVGDSSGDAAVVGPEAAAGNEPPGDAASGLARDAFAEDAPDAPVLGEPDPAPVASEPAGEDTGEPTDAGVEGRTDELPG